MLLRAGGHPDVTQGAPADERASTGEKERAVPTAALPAELGAPLLGYRPPQTLGFLGADVERLGERAGRSRRDRSVDRRGDGALEEQRELAERDLVAALERLHRGEAAPVEKRPVDRAQISNGPRAGGP